MTLLVLIGTLIGYASHPDTRFRTLGVRILNNSHSPLAHPEPSVLPSYAAKDVNASKQQSRRG